MIIDAHHHVFPSVVHERTIESYVSKFGSVARSLRMDFTEDDLRRRLSSFLPDPRGEKLMERMARAGIDVTIMVNMDNVDLGLSEEQALSSNRELASLAAGSGGRIVALAGVDPRRPRAPDLLRRCIEDYGMKGLKWHPDNGYALNSKESYAVLEVAQRLRVTVLVHSGVSTLPLHPDKATKVQHHSGLCQPMEFDEVTQDFPELKVVAAHMGRFNWREWISLAQFRPNFFGDLAMWQQFAVAGYERFCRDLREILDVAGRDSVLFGSDGPGWTAMVPNERWIQIIRDLPHKAPQGIKFSIEEVEAILGENARKAYGL